MTTDPRQDPTKQRPEQPAPKPPQPEEPVPQPPKPELPGSPNDPNIPSPLTRAFAHSRARSHRSAPVNLIARVTLRRRACHSHRQARTLHSVCAARPVALALRNEG